MTQDADEKLGHFVCSTKLTYTDEDRKLESLDINYEVKRMEGGDSPFELSWETIPTLLGDADPIANLAGRITYPWIQKEKEEQGRIWTMKQKEVEVLAKNEVIAYAKANPPIPRTREELLQEASTAELESGSMSNPALIEAVLTETSFGDLNGDGHDDLAAIQAYKERDLQRGESGTVTTYTLWVFEQYPVKYGERFLVRPVSLGTIGMSSNDQAPPYSHLKIADGKVSVGTPDGEEHKVGINKLEPFPAFDNEQYNAMVSDRLNKLSEPPRLSRRILPLRG